MIAPSPLIATLPQSLTPASGNATVSGEAFPGVAMPAEPLLAPEFRKSAAAPLSEAGQDLPTLLDDSSRFAIAITTRTPPAGLPEVLTGGTEAQSTPDAATPRRDFTPAPSPSQRGKLAESVIALPVPSPAAPKSRHIGTSASPELPAATGDEREADIGPVTQVGAVPSPTATTLPVSVQPTATNEPAEMTGPKPKIAAIVDASVRQPVMLDRPTAVSSASLSIDGSDSNVGATGAVVAGIPASKLSQLEITEPASRATLPNLPVDIERPAEPVQVGRADVAPAAFDQVPRSAPVAAMISIALDAIKSETAAETRIDFGPGDLARPAAANGTSSISFNLGVQAGILAPAPGAATQGLQIDPGQAAIDRQLDLSTASAWLDDLARDISAAVATREKLSFSLSPEHLGRMDVELSTSDAGVTVGFRSDNADARAIIAQAQPRLADELRNNGLRLADTQIFSGAGQEREGNRSAQHQAERTTIVETAGWMPSEAEDEIATAPDGRFA